MAHKKDKQLLLAQTQIDLDELRREVQTLTKVVSGLALHLATRDPEEVEPKAKVPVVKLKPVPVDVAPETVVDGRRVRFMSDPPPVREFSGAPRARAVETWAPLVRALDFNCYCWVELLPNEVGGATVPLQTVWGNNLKGAEYLVKTRMSEQWVCFYKVPMPVEEKSASGGVAQGVRDGVGALGDHRVPGDLREGSAQAGR